MAGAARFDAPEVVLDLAGPPPDRKDTARANVADALVATDYGEALVTVRVNPIDTLWAYRDIVDVVERAGELIDCLAVADVAAPADVEFVDTLLGMIERRIDCPHQIAIEAEVAGAGGLVLVDDIVAASDRLAAVVLDEHALTRALGAPDPAADAVERALDGPRVRVLAAARAAGVDAVIAPAAADGGAGRAAYRVRIARAHALGYDGARAAHPTEVAAALDVFTSG